MPPTTLLPPVAEWTEEEMSTYLSSHLDPTTASKEDRGEVFTPPELVEQVLDTFPESAWTRHDARWLEPSAGKGHFAVAVFHRLQNGLAKWEPDPVRRARHIVEKMLTMVELHRPHCTALRKVFGAKANIVCADATRWMPSSPFPNASRFDFIVGNPPFQDAVRRTGARRITRAKNKLYERITLHCCQQLLSPSGGQLAFVVPSNAFSGNRHAMYTWMVEHAQVTSISFLGKEPNYFPKVQHAMCYFSLRLDTRARTHTRTTCISSSNASFSVTLRNRVCNPVSNWTRVTEQLVQKWIGDKKSPLAHAVRGKAVSSYRGTKYPVVFMPNRTLRTNNAGLAKGKGEKKAVLFVISPETPQFKMDRSGKMGAGPNTFYITFSTATEGNRLEQFLKSDVFAELVACTRTTRQFVKTGMLEHLRWECILKGSRPQCFRTLRKRQHAVASSRSHVRSRKRVKK